MKTNAHYQAVIRAPFGMLGILCEQDLLCGIDFLAVETLLQAPENDFTARICEQLENYFRDATFEFDIPLRLSGTPHQNKVWQAIAAIHSGNTRQYGELARLLSSSPRAVGQACGANPVPIVIPCHRVVSKAGMGGFAHHREGYELSIKRWLLAHEAPLMGEKAEGRRE